MEIKLNGTVNKTRWNNKWFNKTRWVNKTRWINKINWLNQTNWTNITKINCKHDNDTFNTNFNKIIIDNNNSVQFNYNVNQIIKNQLCNCSNNTFEIPSTFKIIAYVSFVITSFSH